MKDVSDMLPVVNNPKIDMEKLLNSYNTDASEEGIKYFIEQIVARLQRKKKRIKDLGEDKFKANSKLFRNNNELENKDFENIEKYIEHIKNSSFDSLIKNEKEFLIFLDNIPKEKKEKIISEHEDKIVEVSQIYGKNEKPKDYLESFEKYIKENPQQIEALKLLKTNSKLFQRKDLKDLILILDAEGYKETDLNSAYKEVNKQNITADILTYIKNVLKGSPIIDKDKKIEDIRNRINKLNKWNTRQTKIIEKIILQLKANMYLTEEDFETGLFKTDFGGYNRINKQLEDLLGEIVSIINEEIIIN